MNINKLHFQPLPGLASKHIQTIVASYLPPGPPPPSQTRLVEIGEEDYLSCEISTPKNWEEKDPTIALIHGMGGDHLSGNQVRLSRKLYLNGYKVVRINLRGCGSGKGLSKLPYNASNSQDILKVLEFLKRQAPFSNISMIGFSLGGSIALKLAGELGSKAKDLVNLFIAVCPPLDLTHAARCIQEKNNKVYHTYFLKRICEQAKPWLSKHPSSLEEFDNWITAPLWGYANAKEYYKACSSIQFIPHIQQTTHLLFAKDDPFICMDALQDITPSGRARAWYTEKGGHLGFLGKTSKMQSPYWMDNLLLTWIKENNSNA